MKFCGWWAQIPRDNSPTASQPSRHHKSRCFTFIFKEAPAEVPFENATATGVHGYLCASLDWLGEETWSKSSTNWECLSSSEKQQPQEGRCWLLGQDFLLAQTLNKCFCGDECVDTIGVAKCGRVALMVWRDQAWVGVINGMQSQLLEYQCSILCS